MSDKRQVIVVGAGPSGSSAAFYLARAGVDVLLVDKETWPRDKICGDGQNSPAFEIYKEMGIYDEARNAACGVSNAIVLSGVEERPVRLESDTLTGFCTPRRVIDDIIRRAAVEKAGCDFMENVEVTDLIRENGYVAGVRGTYNGHPIQVRADAVVIANGSHSMVARQLGVFNEDPDMVFYAARGYFENIDGLDPDVAEMHFPAPMFYPAGYIWLYPQEEEHRVANVGVFMTQRSLAASGMRLEDFFPWWRDNTRIGHQRLGQARLLGQIKGWKLPTCREVGDNVVDGAILVGDAGNGIQSCGGGGFPEALHSGRMAARVLGDALQEGDVSKGRLSQYTRLLGEELNGEYQAYWQMRETMFKTPEQLTAALNTSKEAAPSINIRG